MLMPAAPASAAACWQELMIDWYDGKIDRTYAVPCYRQAIDNMQADLKIYSSAQDDILRALQQVTAGRTKAPLTPPARTTTSPGGDEPQTAAPGTTEAGTADDPVTTERRPRSRERESEPQRTAQPQAAPDEDGSLPVPLLVLGGLALLLIAVGAGGVAWRRFRGGPGPA